MDYTWTSSEVKNKSKSTPISGVQNLGGNTNESKRLYGCSKI